MLIRRGLNDLLDSSLGLRVKKTRKKKVVKKRPEKIDWTSTARRDINKFDLTSYVKDLKDEFESSITDLDFISTTKKPKPILLDVDKKVRAIRFEIPTMNPLHLHSIKMTDKKGKAIAMPIGTTLYTSGQDKAFGVLSDKEQLTRFFNVKGSHKYAFHTDKDKGNSWAVVYFKKSIYIKNLYINNVVGFIDPRWYAPQRALGLTVSISENLKDWNKVYSLGGVKNFEQKAMKLASKYMLGTYKHGEAVFLFTKAVLRSQKKKSASVSKNMLIDVDYKPTLISTVSDLILKERDIEWTTHGMKRSFRYWTKSEKQKYIKAAMNVMEELKELSPDVVFGFGSVLAAIRDKDLLPHDDDMDTLIAFKKSQVKNYIQAMDLVEKFLTKKGYVIKEKKFNVCKVQFGIHKIDVFVAIYEEDGTIGWYPNKRHILKRSDMFPVKTIKLLGENYYIPKDSEKYLEYVYTKKWRKPDPSFKYHRDKTMYADIAY